jgi:hypothetical protein
MGRVYHGVFEGVSVSAIQDLFELTSPTGGAVCVHKIVITDDSTETSEQLPIRLRRGTSGTTSGSGGSSVTPAKTQSGDPAAASLLEANNTTVMSAGTITTVYREGANMVGSGFRYEPTPEERIWISGGERLACHLVAAPGSARVFSGLIIFEEVG